jgi:peptidoglycan/LPS O-acetylase OafA/YrhL
MPNFQNWIYFLNNTLVKKPHKEVVTGQPQRRGDIQGLRALAVLAVVLYHANLPIPGGFVGVDVFFVISGFVITAMLNRERLKSSNRINLFRFYQRRFLRLTPALAAVVLFSVLVSIGVLLPFGPQQNAGYTGLGAMFLSANLAIAVTSGRYFDLPAATNPLLHTWSLSVEEQFYVVFPLILVVTWLLAARHKRFTLAPLAAVTALIFVSFVLTLLRPVLPDAFAWGFYSPVLRSWEFGLGALVALILPLINELNKRVRSIFGLLGLALLAASMWLITASTAFPGVATLLPVVATVFIIVAGGTNGEGSHVSRFLSLKPMRIVGDWSYSIYLWHWPFIVFLVVLFPDQPFIGLIALGVSFGPALLSYYFLEQRIRNQKFAKKKVFFFVAALFVIVPALCSAAVVWSSSHFWLPLYLNGQIAVNHSGDIGQEVFQAELKNSFPCLDLSPLARVGDGEGMTRCRQSQPNSDTTIALVGDSHAEHLYPGFAKALPQENVIYLTKVDAPIMTSPEMAEILAEVKNSKTIETVILGIHWNQRGVSVDQLSDTAQRLIDSGKRVFILNDNPDFTFDAFVCKFNRGLLLGPKCSEGDSYFMSRASDYMAGLQEVKDRVPNVTILDTVQYFCAAGECSMLDNGVLLYRDQHHLNLNGSRYLTDRLLHDSPLREALKL